MLTSSQIMSEFIQALQEEVKALKSSRIASSVMVFNGQLYRKYSELYIYLFHLENFLAVVDDTPAEIEIDGQKYHCQIVSVQGLQVEIALEKDFGEAIAEARIYTNSWFLLELLRKKYEEALKRGEKFRTSEQLFAGASRVISSGQEPRFSPSIQLNDSQKKAVFASFSRSLAIIWGPPGTGKTKTIARAVEAHLNAGRRVLLVSHANIAVDEALEDIAEQLEETAFYKEGRLIRLGIPHKKTLEEKYPLVLLDNATALLSKRLIDEKNKLLQEREQINCFLETYQSLTAVESSIDSLSIEYADIGRLLFNINDRIKLIKTEIDNLKSQQKIYKEKLDSALQAGVLKRLFYRLDPQKIQQELEQVSMSIEAKKRVLSEQENSYAEVKTKLRKKEEELNKAKDDFAKQLASLGITKDQLKSTRKENEERLNDINSRINELDQALGEMQKKVLGEARLIATTLTKTYTSKQFPPQPFDVLIIDEVSMAPLPHIFWAASKVTDFVTLVGDFKQLSPICVSESEVAEKWLKRDIFELLGIKTIEDACQDERVSLLDTQYRMAQQLAAVPNHLFYSGLLKDGPHTDKFYLDEPISGKNHLVLVNTSPLNPWASRLSTSGRFNIYSALISTSLARRVMNYNNGERVGIITPYRAQARLINKIAKDWGILDRIRVSTVHSFQGGEEQVIIFDCVEGPGVPRWSMLDQNAYADACRLLNVAITRAKCKIFMVAHKDHLFSELKGDAIILSIIEKYCSEGCEITSENLIDSYLAADFEKWADALLSAGSDFDPSQSSLYTEKNFWPAFFSDLRSAEESLVIMSPFISLGRAGKLMDYFRALIGKGVSICIYTRPISQQGQSLATHAESVIDQLESIGVKVIRRNQMHQKIAILDGKVVWEGSLNILSHKDSKEQMRRIEEEETVKEIIRLLELDQSEAEGTERFCPVCLEKGIKSRMVLKKGRYGAFYSCERFPECRHAENLRRHKFS